jgi:hypothetical protein
LPVAAIQRDIAAVVCLMLDKLNDPPFAHGGELVPPCHGITDSRDGGASVVAQDFADASSFSDCYVVHFD